MNQGRFQFNAERSGFWPARMKAFPENTEIETVATYTVENAGVVVKSVVDRKSTRLNSSHLGISYAVFCLKKKKNKKKKIKIKKKTNKTQNKTINNKKKAINK